MELDWGQAQLLRYIAVFYFLCLLQGQALDPLRHVGARCDSRATPECLELDIGDYAVVVHPNL